MRDSTSMTVTCSHARESEVTRPVAASTFSTYAAYSYRIEPVAASLMYSGTATLTPKPRQ